MMFRLLNEFEASPRDMAIVGMNTTDSIFQSIRFSEIVPAFNSFRDMNIRNFGVHISNDLFFRQPDRIRKTVVHVHFEDYKGIQSTLTFEVKKKQETEMKRLRTLAAETVANNITKGGDIDIEHHRLGHLRVPIPLLKDIKKEYDEFLQVDSRPISIPKSLETRESGMSVEAGSHRT